MKKLILLFGSFLLFLVLSACGLTSQSTTTVPTTAAPTTTSEIITTLTELETPTNFSVVDNIVTFDTVVNASKYKLFVYDSSDSEIKSFNVTNGFNLLLLLQPGTYRFRIAATASGYLDSQKSEVLESAIIDPNMKVLLEGEDMNDFQFVRWLGRTYYNPMEELKYFYFTASGFELGFYGTELKVTLKATNYNVSGKQPYLVALIDGEEDPTKGTTIKLDKSESEYTIVTGLEEGFHTVKILKRSEASDSNTAVKNISTDGYFTQAPAPKSFRVQFIAASSSTGYGNLGSLSVAKSTDNSHGLLAFAYLTTYLLDADISIFSASGWGVSRGYNTGGAISTTQNIPAAYEYYAIDATNTVLTNAGEWNHSDFEPDVIVVNLGTNDFNASSYNSMSAENKLIMSNRFVTDYTAFLRVLNNTHPNAKIIVAYGLMGEQNTVGPFTIEAINNANNLIGETKVYPFIMQAAGTAPNPFGSNYHPNVGTSKIVAQDLAEFINEITGREIVRTMITGSN